MNLFSFKDIKLLLARYNIKPAKGLGQNFLINKRIAEKIIKTADLKSEDIVLEIGPGIGNLTQELAKAAKKIISVEKDGKMVEILKKTLKDYKNVEIVSGDVLKFEIWKLFRNLKLEIRNFKVVANLPYYIASPVIRKFLESDIKPEIMVFTLQKEVAQRICAAPPSPRRRSFKKTSGPGAKMNLLAVSVQFYAKPEIISYVSKENFWPKPKVDSAIIKISPCHQNRRSSILVAGGNKQSREKLHLFRDIFFKVIKAGFSHPRKQLVNNLSKGLKIDKAKVAEILSKSGIKPSQRAETLTIEDWIKIISKLT
jgi:16S rRNA (adenine1518-N6/adenine1519-N6)-dimethyltransferase